MLANNKPFIIGVAGGTGSGKTTVVQTIVNSLHHQDVVTIQHDSYYKDRSNLSSKEKRGINYDHPDALETGLLINQLKSLISGVKVEVPIYDFVTHTRKKKGVFVSPAKSIIVEGVLIFNYKELCNLFDLRIFVDTDDDIRFIRRLQRDIKERQRTVDSVIRQYLNSVRTMHIEFVEPSRKYADIIVPEGHNPIATEMVTSIIKDKISCRQ